VKQEGRSVAVPPSTAPAAKGAPGGRGPRNNEEEDQVDDVIYLSHKQGEWESLIAVGVLC
jgi:hypothetical protein